MIVINYKTPSGLCRLVRNVLTTYTIAWVFGSPKLRRLRSRTCTHGSQEHVQSPNSLSLHYIITAKTIIYTPKIIFPNQSQT